MAKGLSSPPTHSAIRSLETMRRDLFARSIGDERESSHLNGMKEMEDRDLENIGMRPIGFVSRTSASENDRDRSLVAKIVVDEDFAPALDGIEEWSHIYVIFWLDRVARSDEPVLRHPNGLGIFAARSPIHPNPIGLTLVELVKREENVLWVRDLDAYDGTPVLDIKPYPDWEQGRLIVVTDFRVPEWLTRLMEQQE
jgi:tRNA-Thr(GGU) m(6)t(6)A37 methyltransferase TsaA